MAKCSKNVEFLRCNSFIRKTFPIDYPNVDKVEIIRVGKVRRAKLYYLRDRVGKASKVKEKI